MCQNSWTCLISRPFSKTETNTISTWSWVQLLSWQCPQRSQGAFRWQLRTTHSQTATNIPVCLLQMRLCWRHGRIQGEGGSCPVLLPLPSSCPISNWKCLQYGNPYCNSRYTRTGGSCNLPNLTVVEYVGAFPGGSHGNKKCSARPCADTWASTGRHSIIIIIIIIIIIMKDTIYMMICPKGLHEHVA